MLARDKSHLWLAVIKFETVPSSSFCKRGPWMRLRIGHGVIQRSVQNLIFWPFPTIHLRPWVNNSLPLRRAFHEWESVMDLDRRNSVLWKCVCFKKFVQTLFEFFHKRHAWLVRKASLLFLISLIPKPPEHLVLVTVSQARRCTCFCVGVSPQRKLRIDLSIRSETPLGRVVLCI